MKWFKQRLALTAEDAEIIESRLSRQDASRYQIADDHALIRTSCALVAFGSVVDCVATMERAKLFMERGRQP